MDVICVSTCHNMSTSTPALIFLLSVLPSCLFFVCHSKQADKGRTEPKGGEEGRRGRRRRYATIFGLKALLIYSCFPAFSLRLQLSHPASSFLFLPIYIPSKLSQFRTFSLPFDCPGTRSLSVLFSAQPHFFKSLLFSHC